MVRSSCQDNEEHHGQGTCHEDEGEEGEERACGVSVDVLMMQGLKRDNVRPAIVRDEARQRVEES